MKWKIFAIISSLLLVFFWVQIIFTYLVRHDYYFDMLASFDNNLLVFFWFLISLIPALYLIFSKKVSILWFLGWTFLAKFLFWIAFIAIKDQIIGGGFFMFLINSALFYVLILLFVIGLFSLWNYVKERILKINTDNVFEVLLSFWFGLAILLVVVFALLSFGLLYSALAWAMFFWMLFLAYLQKEKLYYVSSLLIELFENFKESNLKKDKLNYLGIGLFSASLMYLFFGFMLAFIPYPTAWDANHAYMFNPKVWEENAWFYWDWDEWETWDTQIWYSYITYWFALWTPLEYVYWLSADTYAIVMNFLSWFFVLILWLALFREVLKYIRERSELQWKWWLNEKLVFYIWWFLLLLWLTSWMWAFLVFVDNKTDLWVLTFVILAIYSWIIAIKKVTEYVIQNWYAVINKNFLMSFGISGFLFAMAVMSKPTAMLDAVWFGLLLLRLWVWILAVLWVFLMIIGLLSFISFRWIENYIPYTYWFFVFLSWIGLTVFDFMKTFFRQYIPYIVYIFVWWGVFVASIFVVQWSYVFYETIISEDDLKPMDFLEDVYLSKTSPSLDIQQEDNRSEEEQKRKLLASTEHNSLHTSDNNNSCSLENIDDTSDLYDEAEEAPGDTYEEDVWRYIGFWQRTFENPWWWMFLPQWNYCLWPSSSANKLCSQKDILYTQDKWKIQDIKNEFDEWSTEYEKLDGLLQTWFDNSSVTNWYEDKLSDIQDHIEDTVITVENVCIVASEDQEVPEDCRNIYIGEGLEKDQMQYQKDVSIPYNYLVPFNLVFNWSLQNESSYYTDVGYIRLILLIFVFMSLIYSIIVFDKFLIWVSWVTILVWTIWFFIGGGIFWYWLGLVVWTIITFILFVYRLLSDQEDDKLIWPYIFVVSLFIAMFIMLYLNFIRISTQGGWWPFMWYKQWAGYETTVNVDENTGEIDQVQQIETPYTKEDVFSMQFWHYDKFIEKVDQRKVEEGLFIAWTYAQYFLENQSNIESDNFVTRLWEMTSDEDVCNSYLRLKDQWIKYIALDPNIGTVVMGDGNISLFHRFFAEINEHERTIENHWALSMLIKMAQNWYIKLQETNNIGLKYAFEADDELIMNIVDQLDMDYSEEDLTFLRGMMWTARYWQDSPEYIELIMNIFSNRLQEIKGLEDLASIHGKNVDVDELEPVAASLIGWAQNPQSIQQFQELGSDKRELVLNYVELVNILRQDQNMFRQQASSLINQSIWGSSQILFLERK